MTHILIVLGNNSGLVKNRAHSSAHSEEWEIPEGVHLHDRLTKTLEVWNDLAIKHGEGVQRIVVCCGGCSNKTRMVPGSTTMKKWLVANGIPETRILEEPYSLNTVENCICAYEVISSFIRSAPTINRLNNGFRYIYLSPYSPPVEIENDELLDLSTIFMHIITSDYHIRRSMVIFSYFMDRLLEGTYYLTGESSATTHEKDKAVMNEANVIANIGEWFHKYNEWYLTMTHINERRPLQ